MRVCACVCACVCVCVCVCGVSCLGGSTKSQCVSLTSRMLRMALCTRKSLPTRAMRVLRRMTRPGSSSCSFGSLVRRPWAHYIYYGKMIELAYVCGKHTRFSAIVYREPFDGASGAENSTDIQHDWYCPKLWLLVCCAVYIKFGTAPLSPYLLNTCQKKQRTELLIKCAWGETHHVCPEIETEQILRHE